jgi:hypothetical protein
MSKRRRLTKSAPRSCIACGEGLRDDFLATPDGNICMQRSRGGLLKRCCAAGGWDPELHCCVLGGRGCHSTVQDAEPQVFKVSPGRWACKNHRWAVALHGDAEESSQELTTALAADAAKCHSHATRFPPGARARLVGGKLAAATGKNGWQLFFEVTVLSATTDHVRRGLLPRPAGLTGPLVGDPIMAFAWKESAFTEWDPTSHAIRTGLSNFISGQNAGAADALSCEAVSLASEVVLLAAGARRLGGRNFVGPFLQRAGEMLGSLSVFSRCWDPVHRAAKLEIVALAVAEACLRKGQNPLTQAHLPQSAGHNAISAVLSKSPRGLEGPSLRQALETTRLHWRGLRGRSELELDGGPDSDRSDDEETADACPQAHPEAVLGWAFLASDARGIGATLLSGATCAEASCYWSRNPGWEGSQFLMTTPLRDVVQALCACGLLRTLPSDWASWSPPGPGARRALRKLRPGKAEDAVDLTGGRRRVRAVWDARLRAIHAWLLEDEGRRQRLESLVPPDRVGGQTWLLHDTQSALCYYHKYCAWRRAVLHGEPLACVARFYERASPWVERLLE